MLIWHSVIHVPQHAPKDSKINRVAGIAFLPAVVDVERRRTERREPVPATHCFRIVYSVEKKKKNPRFPNNALDFQQSPAEISQHFARFVWENTKPHLVAKTTPMT